MSRRLEAGIIGASTTLLLLCVICAVEAQTEQLKVAGLRGKAPSELATLFPGVLDAQAGRQIAIQNWRSWKTVYLSFNAKKRLTSMTFVASSPMAETDAKGVVEKELGVSLPKKKEVRAPGLIAYREMEGLIKTINLPYADWKTDRRIGEIGIFFRLGWDE